MTHEFEKKYRPQNLPGIIGQPKVCGIVSKWIEEDRIPHTVILTGPTGTGKTTTARILSRHLGCSPNEKNPDFIEMNCADCRSIETPREIAEMMGTYPMTGKARVWILDEVIQLPEATQKAFLKILEDTPKTVYFFLCASEPESLIPAFVKRCHPLVFEALAKKDLMMLLRSICNKEKRNPIDTVLEAIVERAEGSARYALILLDSALTIDDGVPSKQIETLKETRIETMIEDFVRMLHRKDRPRCNDLMKAVANIKRNEAESLRWRVLGYTDAVMIRNPTPTSRAWCNLIYANFMDPWTNCGLSGLLKAIFDITQGK